MTRRISRQLAVRPRRAAHRRLAAGYSLIELLVVISLVSVLLSGVGVTLHLLARLNKQLREELPGTELLARLSSSLRRDAHEATGWKLERVDTASPNEPQADSDRPLSTSPASPASTLRLQLSDQTEVVYTDKESMIVRETFQEGKRIHRETFRLSRGSVVEWAVSNEPVELVTLRIEQSKGRLEAHDSRRVIRVVAALDLDSQ